MHPGMLHFNLLLVSVLGMVPQGARACWWGEGATVGRVCLSFGTGNFEAGPLGFSLKEAREYAVAAHQMALLAPTAEVRVQFGDYSSCGEDEVGESAAGVVVLCPDDGRCLRSDLHAWDLDAAVDLVGRLAKADAPTRARASRSPPPPVFTVQLLASRDKDRANLLSARVDEVGVRGSFYWSGGMPARHPSSEVFHGGDGLHRVLAGAFLTRRQANLARAELRHVLGVEGFVWTLPP